MIFKSAVTRSVSVARSVSEGSKSDGFSALVPRLPVFSALVPRLRVGLGCLTAFFLGGLDLRRFVRPPASLVGRLVPLAMAFCLAGCQADLPRGEVEGTLTINGRAEAGLLVIYVHNAEGTKAGARSAGVTDDRGHYRLLGEDQRPGAVAGEHRVIVQDMAIYSAPRSPDGTVIQLPPTRIPPVYQDVLTTPIVQQVDEGKQTIDFDLPGPR